MEEEGESKDFFFRDGRSNNINPDKIVTEEEEMDDAVEKRRIDIALSLKGQKQMGSDTEIKGIGLS